ncbi:hypothetical protein P7C73_g2166, partial [Tremellales sp. Uapishka_1]
MKPSPTLVPKIAPLLRQTPLPALRAEREKGWFDGRGFKKDDGAVSGLEAGCGARRNAQADTAAALDDEDRSWTSEPRLAGRNFPSRADNSCLKSKSQHEYSVTQHEFEFGFFSKSRLATAGADVSVERFPLDGLRATTVLCPPL